MAKFRGTLEELQQLISDSGIMGSWEDKGTFNQFKSYDEGILNFFNNGTVNFQGKAEGKLELESLLSDAKPIRPAQHRDQVREQSTAYGSTAKQKIFVVYGHDTTSREQLELVLHKLEINPFVLSNTGGKGLTVIEALEDEIIIKNECSFGIVLLTPDDVGYSKKDGPDKAEPRARQNVVLEMGMLISSLGRQNVAILKKGHLEVPSDASGILYLAFNDHVKETVPRLVDRLTHAGFKLRPECITNATS